MFFSEADIVPSVAFEFEEIGDVPALHEISLDSVAGPSSPLTKALVSLTQ